MKYSDFEVSLHSISVFTVQVREPFRAVCVFGGIHWRLLSRGGDRILQLLWSRSTEFGTH